MMKYHSQKFSFFGKSSNQKSPKFRDFKLIHCGFPGKFGDPKIYSSLAVVVLGELAAHFPVVSVFFYVGDQRDQPLSASDGKRTNLRAQFERGFRVQADESSAFMAARSRGHCEPGRQDDADALGKGEKG